MEKFVKVGIIGTHGTRKTSLCYELAGILKSRGVNAGVMEEIARELPRFPGFDINEGTTRESQEYIFHSQILGELKYWARGDVNPLITDRAVIDNYMYYIYKFGKDNPSLDAFATNWTKTTYGLLIRLPLIKDRRNTSLKGDPVRATSDEFKIGIDVLLEEELKRRNISFYDYTTTEDVIKKIMTLM